MATPSQLPEFLTLSEDFAYYRPVAEMTLEEAIERINDALLFCRENGIVGILVDITQLSGFPPPSLTDRFWFIAKWAETSGGRVVVSMVAPPEMIMPDKIGVTMALNRGLRTDVFTREEDAIKWLRSACL